MKKLIHSILLIISILTLHSCVTEHQLYFWGDMNDYGESEYELKTYADFKHHNAKRVCDLIDMYEYLIENAINSETGIPAPGICADYGFLLLNPETFVFYADQMEEQGVDINITESKKQFHDRGIEMIYNEIEYYPQSKKILQPYIEKIVADEK